MLSSPYIQSKPDRTLSIITMLRDCNASLTLVSTYKGMALSQEILLLNVLPGKVVVEAPQDRLLMGLSSPIYLYSQDFSETLQAQVQEVKEGRMILSNLTTTGRSWKERASERIQPRSPIYAEVYMNKVSIRASIEDLSITGMRLSAYKLFERGLSLHSEVIGRVRFHLPGDALEMTMKAEVVYFKSIGKMVKSGVRIYPSHSQADRLQRYIATRQKEILQELDQKCVEMHEPQKVCNLFF